MDLGPWQVANFFDWQIIQFCGGGGVFFFLDSVGFGL